MIGPCSIERHSELAFVRTVYSTHSDLLAVCMKDKDTSRTYVHSWQEIQHSLFQQAHRESMQLPGVHNFTKDNKRRAAAVMGSMPSTISIFSSGPWRGHSPNTLSSLCLTVPHITKDDDDR